MHEKLKHTFALSDKGAKDMVKAFFACILHNLSLMVPVVLLYNLISDLLDGGLPEGKNAFYIAGLVIALGLIMLTCYIQYNATFFATYVESGVRRLSLAEKLRKIPLSFFGKKDLSDLTTVLMADCATLESGLSHWVPEFIGLVISTLLIAARLANVDEFAEKLPDKWNTLIGENGCELSGGERQRISIARAFLKNAPIILLDEATASLDVENETLIQESLSKLIENKTVMIIAHRMRTVAGADQIVVLSEGTVAEQGSSDTLLKKNGIYARMVKLQTQSQNWVME